MAPAVNPEKVGSEEVLLALSSHALSSEKVRTHSGSPELSFAFKTERPARSTTISDPSYMTRPKSTLYSATMALEDARMRLYEDQVILHTPRPKLAVGKISEPDHLGWRWFQCTKSLQIFLPPDVGIRYSVFLKMEKKLLKHASSHTSIQLYNVARNDFICQCLCSKPAYPVRGISPSKHRYALEPGFKCTSIDELVAKDERIADALCMTTFDARLVRRSELGALGPQNEWGRSWVRLSESTQVLLPADVTYQYYEFIRSFVLCDASVPRSVWEAALANFTKTCKDHARYLGIYSGDRLYVLERDMSSPVLGSLSSVLRTHYLGLTDGAQSYARSLSLSPSISDLIAHDMTDAHTKSRTAKTRRSLLFPSTSTRANRSHTTKLTAKPKHHKRFVCELEFKPVLEPLVEEPEDITEEGESDADETEWDSTSSFDFSEESTILGSPSTSPSSSTEHGLGSVGIDGTELGKELNDDLSSISSMSLRRRAILFFLGHIF